MRSWNRAFAAKAIPGAKPMHRARLSHCAATLTLLLALLLGATVPSTAQNWPTRPVKFILTLGPGSGADISARLLADRLAEKWGQPIVIENKPGGDGIVAINAFVSAQDDLVVHRPPLPARHHAVQSC
jgi:tripartite-type tricarboxylate transporter receptor subunit TctC